MQLKTIVRLAVSNALLSPDASSKGTIEMGVVRPCVWFPDDNL